MTLIDTAIVLLKTLTLVLGGLITYFALKAYRRVGSRPLRLLVIGFGFVTVGSLLAGIADQFTALTTEVAIVTESSLTVIGFGVILYSLFVRG